MTESPYSNDLIEYLVAAKEATELWPHVEDRPDGTAADELIFALVEGMGWGEEHVNFLNSLSAGNSSADSARDVSRTPAWGRARLKELRERLKSDPSL